MELLGQMTRLFVVLLVAVFLISGLGLVAGRGHANEAESEGPQMIALDLTDLEIPGEGSESEMELPPIQGTEGSEMEPEPPAPPPQAAEVEKSQIRIPAATRPVESPDPGLAPFLLEDPGDARAVSTRPSKETVEAPVTETSTEEFPSELKTVPPPPSRAESLKMPSAGDASGSGEPELPVLKDLEGSQEVSVGRDSSLTMKPLPDLRGSSSAGRDSGGSQERRRPEDYLQVSEDFDEQLVDLYERYYKGR
jgi:hypothetical protein